MLTKANQAIMSTPAFGIHQQPPRVIRIKKLPSGALYLEADSEASAELLQQPGLANECIKNFSNTSILKPNNYLIIVEFIPTTFNPSACKDLEKVERANSLQPDDITTA